MNTSVTPELIRSLKYVKISEQTSVIQNFPDFMVIGPQRTGTTWLCQNLELHPEIFVSRPKELFFFSRLDPAHPQHKTNQVEDYLKYFEYTPWYQLRKQYRTLKRYGQFFRPKVRGEGTATYAALPPEVIGEIAALNPALKIILLIRNPLKRAWSHAKKDVLWRSGRALSEIPDEEFIAFFRQDYQIRCSQYSQILANWSAALPASQVFYRSFDIVSANPRQLLLDIFAFLGVSQSERYIGDLAEKKIAQTISQHEDYRMPEQFRPLLENLFAEENERLEKLLGERPRK